MMENLKKILKNINSLDLYYDNKELQDNLTKLFKILYPNISQILKIYKDNNKFFYRGISSSENIFIYKPRKNRKPKDTSMEGHNFFNKILNSYTNNKVNRSNATFATSNFYEADKYGNVFIIFPFNNFDYLFSNKIKDLYDFYKKSKETIYNKKIFNKKYALSFFRNGEIIIRIMKNNEDVNVLFEEMKTYYRIYHKKILSKYKFDEANTKEKKIEKILYILRHEILGEKHENFIQNLLKKYTINIFDDKTYIDAFKKTVDKYYKFNTNIEEALKTKTEVMFRTDYVLCVHHELLNKTIFLKILEKIKK